MKLAKALKEKNRLVGELARLKAIILRENSRSEKSTSKIDRKKIWDDYTIVTAHLVAIKTAIFKANAGIYHTIAAIGEAKSLAEWIKVIDVQDGLVETPSFRGEPTKNTFTAYLKQEDIDTMTAKLQDQIAAFQDELDTYNATVDVEV